MILNSLNATSSFSLQEIAISFTEESFIDAKECNLKSLLKDIGKSTILELWQVKYSQLSLSAPPLGS